MQQSLATAGGGKECFTLGRGRGGAGGGGRRGGTRGRICARALISNRDGPSSQSLATNRWTRESTVGANYADRVQALNRWGGGRGGYYKYSFAVFT